MAQPATLMSPSGKSFGCAIQPVASNPRVKVVQSNVLVVYDRLEDYTSSVFGVSDSIEPHNILMGLNGSDSNC